MITSRENNMSKQRIREQISIATTVFWPVCNVALFALSLFGGVTDTHTHTMSTPDLEAAPSADPGEYARLLKERVAPVLSEGLLLSLRDRPTDPPAYLAEFLASNGSEVSSPAVVA